MISAVAVNWYVLLSMSYIGTNESESNHWDPKAEKLSPLQVISLSFLAVCELGSSSAYMP